ncbi:hypothetical protein [Nostoc sp. CCY0012]|uniref:hypothetical protein n=1 Tax=Nostoc sp. CCY0012 TaxID=1056123 RepID=UPI0039C5DABC
MSQNNIQDGLIVLVPYDAGQEFYSSYRDEEVYLPVYVATNDKDLALMAVAHLACQSVYVTFSSSDETQKEWKKRKYPGTARKPKLDLPRTYKAYEIPEPGDCFCCAGMKDFEVMAPEQFLKRLQTSPNDFVLSLLKDEDEDERENDIWQEFDNWCVKFFNYSLFTKV